MQKDAIFIRRFLNTLKDNKIEYCILRKADEIIAGKAHDIDIVVDFSRFKDISELLHKISNELDWKLFFKTIKDEGNLIAVHYYNKSDKQISIVHFDMFNNYSWNAIPLIKNRELLQDKIERLGFYSCGHTIEAITKLFSVYLYHSYIKDEYKKDIVYLFGEYRDSICAKMGVFLDQDYVNKIYETVVKEDWEGLKLLRSKIVISIQKKNHKTLWIKILAKVKTLYFKINRYIKHKGVMVAFLGTDGSGKSTIINSLPVVLGRTFDENQIQYHHWRPGFIKSPKGIIGSSANALDPHKLKQYNKFISLGKFLYFNLDYILGYWLSVKVHLGKNQLVVFDRYYYDYMIDKSRYRLDLSDVLVNIVRHFIPKPDITFLLCGTPEIIYERKKELTVEELKVQNDKLMLYKDKCSNPILINVDKSIECVVFDVCDHIVKFMENRENR